MELGDVVVRSSYNKDIKFKIVGTKYIEGKKVFILKGKNIRIIADAFENDLEVVDNKYEEKLFQDVRSKIKNICFNNKKKYKSAIYEKGIQTRFENIDRIKNVKKKVLILVRVEDYYM